MIYLAVAGAVIPTLLFIGYLLGASVGCVL